jgi:hypothetical protein
MNCEACRAAAAHDNSAEIASRLHAACKAVCGCEKYKLSDHSPSPVSDQETLNLIISDPQSIKDGKILHPGVLVQIDRAGLSVLRDQADNDEFEMTIQELNERARASGGERFFHGVCAFAAGSIRHDESARFLCVYDTGLAMKPNHADIVGPDHKAMAEDLISKGEQERRNRARIKKLIDRVRDSFVPAKTFRGGVFISHSRNVLPNGA